MGSILPGFHAFLPLYLDLEHKVLAAELKTGEEGVVSRSSEKERQNSRTAPWCNPTDLSGATLGWDLDQDVKGKSTKRLQKM